MTWFEILTGFRETSPSQVRDNIVVAGDTLTSRVNGRTFTCGRLETPSLGQLRHRVGHSPPASGRPTRPRIAPRGSPDPRLSPGPGAPGDAKLGLPGLSLREVVADVSDLHADESNAGCLFQVASQFNLLEMVSPRVTPERGVGIYENDPTQGPACAIAAGAGTIYRNYLAIVDGRPGQSETRQIDCLSDLGLALGNAGERLWQMKNGYALPSRDGLMEISKYLKAASKKELDQLRQRLRIGIQWNTQVTIRDSTHLVTQAYCSALPVAYSRHPYDLWEDFARLVLEASYEATICTAILNALSTGNNHVFLTLLGGGAFGNQAQWIADSIERALRAYQDQNLDVAIVSYRRSKPVVRQLVEEFRYR